MYIPGLAHQDCVPGCRFARSALVGPDAPQSGGLGFTSHSVADAWAVTVLDETMAPTLRRGDVVWAVPARGYAFEGLYVFERFGTPDVSRAEALGPDVIHVTKDAPDYLPHVMTRAEFEALVIGRVVAPALFHEKTSG